MNKRKNLRRQRALGRLEVDLASYKDEHLAFLRSDHEYHYNRRSRLECEIAILKQRLGIK
jgi:hypothetical protein